VFELLQKIDMARWQAPLIQVFVRGAQQESDPLSHVTAQSAFTAGLPAPARNSVTHARFSRSLHPNELLEPDPQFAHALAGGVVDRIDDGGVEFANAQVRSPPIACV
jgi:hypothetical protein